MQNSCLFVVVSISGNHFASMGPCFRKDEGEEEGGMEGEGVEESERFEGEESEWFNVMRLVTGLAKQMFLFSLFLSISALFYFCQSLHFNCSLF